MANEEVVALGRWGEVTLDISTTISDQGTHIECHLSPAVGESSVSFLTHDI